MRRGPSTRGRRLLVFAVAAAAILPAGAARSDAGRILWTPPTPPERATLVVRAGSELRVTLTATTASGGAVVHIAAVEPPTGAVFESADDVAARATLAWAPSAPGRFAIRFVASSQGGGASATRTVFVRVQPPLRYPRREALGRSGTAWWATVWHKAPARTTPSPSAPALTTLQTKTVDGTQNIVLVLAAVDISPTQTWYRVRLPILPNNSTGWVEGSALGRLFPVDTHLYVDRTAMTATLKRGGTTIFEAPVGIGRPSWPTPRGEFYIRDKLTSFDDPFYGPVAFGTNGRSAVLTDWPGGGFIGLHGTNRPDLVPGRISHGCVQLRNEDLLRLAALLPVGTPLTIH